MTVLSKETSAALLSVKQRESFFPNPMAAALFDERYKRGRYKLLPYNVVGRGSCEGYFVFDTAAAPMKGRCSEVLPLEKAALVLESLFGAQA